MNNLTNQKLNEQGFSFKEILRVPHGDSYISVYLLANDSVGVLILYPYGSPRRWRIQLPEDSHCYGIMCLCGCNGTIGNLACRQQNDSEEESLRILAFKKFHQDTFHEDWHTLPIEQREQTKTCWQEFVRNESMSILEKAFQQDRIEVLLVRSPKETVSGFFPEKIKLIEAGYPEGLALVKDWPITIIDQRPGATLD
jgi:hypothetical protein